MSLKLVGKKSLKLISKSSFEKHRKECPSKALKGFEEGGPNLAIICEFPACPLVQDKAAYRTEDEAYICFVIGDEKIQKLKERCGIDPLAGRT